MRKHVFPPRGGDFSAALKINQFDYCPVVALCLATLLEGI